MGYTVLVMIAGAALSIMLSKGLSIQHSDGNSLCNLFCATWVVFCLAIRDKMQNLLPQIPMPVYACITLATVIVWLAISVLAGWTVGIEPSPGILICRFYHLCFGLAMMLSLNRWSRRQWWQAIESRRQEQ